VTKLETQSRSGISSIFAFNPPMRIFGKVGNFVASLTQQILESKQLSVIAVDRPPVVRKGITGIVKNEYDSETRTGGTVGNNRRSPRGVAER
jgi:hypothetical protein